MLLSLRNKGQDIPKTANSTAQIESRTDVFLLRNKIAILWNLESQRKRWSKARSYSSAHFLATAFKGRGTFCSKQRLLRGWKPQYNDNYAYRQQVWKYSEWKSLLVYLLVKPCLSSPFLYSTHSHQFWPTCSKWIIPFRMPISTRSKQTHWWYAVKMSSLFLFWSLQISATAEVQLLSVTQERKSQHSPLCKLAFISGQ